MIHNTKVVKYYEKETIIFKCMFKDRDIEYLNIISTIL